MQTALQTAMPTGALRAGALAAATLAATAGLAAPAAAQQDTYRGGFVKEKIWDLGGVYRYSYVEGGDNEGSGPTVSLLAAQHTLTCRIFLPRAIGRAWQMDSTRGRHVFDCTRTISGAGAWNDRDAPSYLCFQRYCFDTGWLMPSGACATSYCPEGAFSPEYVADLKQDIAAAESAREESDRK